MQATAHELSCLNRHHLCWNATHYIDCNGDHPTIVILNACPTNSVCNLDNNSQRTCLPVHSDYVPRFRTIVIKKKRKQQQVALQEHMPSNYPNLQNIASLLTAPSPPAANRPPPEDLPDIIDEIAFLSDLVAFPILRPNRRPHPTASSTVMHDDSDFGEWPNDVADDKPVETAAEPFRCRFFGRYAHPTDCRRYYQCHGSGDNYSERWCDDGLAFNPRWLRCESDWSICKDIPWCKTNHQLLPDFHDKQHYFICVRRTYIFFVEDYSVYRRTCPSSEQFNLSEKKCIEAPHPKLD